ncbi:MAG: type II secretion system protein [Elusimicrobia bacterium]|nr:type II secretion system protein [Elusimicrobiota bacterium]
MKRNGFTVVEMIVVMTVLVVLGSFFAWLLRSSSDGFRIFQRRSPLQRDIQTALQAVQGDLLSASQSSIGNRLPDLGFERVPPALSTSPVANQWSWVPRPMSMHWGLGMNATRLFFVRYDSSQVWRGRSSLLVAVGSWMRPEAVDSPGFNLSPGEYSLSAEVRDPWQGGFEACNVVLQKFQAGVFVDSFFIAPVVLPPPRNTDWYFIRQTFVVPQAGALPCAIAPQWVYYWCMERS